MKLKFLYFVYLVLSCAFSQAVFSTDCGTPIKKINASNTDELASFIFIDKKTDTEFLYFLSVNEAGSGSNSNKHSDLYYSTRRILKSTDTYNNIWNYPSFIKWCKNDEGQMRNMNLGPMTVWGNDMIFAMESEPNNGGYKISYDGNSKFDLYIMPFNTGNLGCRSPLSAVNLDGFWDSHPAFSIDGSILYFASDRPGGKGGTDIYYSKRNNDGSWSAPVNIVSINTPGNEVSPHCGYDGLFYFATDWDYEKSLLSKSGKNIHVAKYATTGEPIRPINLDKHVRDNSPCPSSCEKYNTEYDDLFPFVSADKSYLYISSADKNGKYDIKVFSLYKPSISLKCNFTDIITDNAGNYLSQNFRNTTAFFKITDVYGKTTAFSAGDIVSLEPDSRYKVEPDYSVDKCKNGEILGQKVFIVNTSKPSGCDTILEREFSYKGNFVSEKFSLNPQCFIPGYWKPMNIENLGEFRGRASEGFFRDIPVIDKNFDDNVIASNNDEEISKIYASIDKIIRDNYECLNFEGIKMRITLNAFAFASGIQNMPYPDEEVTTKKFEIAKGSRFNDPQKGNLTLSRLRAYYTYKTLHNLMLVRSNFYKSLYSKGRIVYETEGYGVSQVAVGSGDNNSLDVNKVDIYVDFAPNAWIDNTSREENGKLAFRQEILANNEEDLTKKRKINQDEEIITSTTDIPVINKDVIKDTKKEPVKNSNLKTKETSKTETKTVTNTKKAPEKEKKVTVVKEKIHVDSVRAKEKKVVVKEYKKPQLSVKPKEKKIAVKLKDNKTYIKDTVKKITVNKKPVKAIEKPKEKKIAVKPKDNKTYIKDTVKKIAVNKKSVEANNNPKNSQTKDIAKVEKQSLKTHVEKSVTTVKKKVPIEKKKVVVVDKQVAKPEIIKAHYTLKNQLKDFESLITEYQKTDKYSVNCGAYVKESNCANLVGFLKNSGVQDVRIVPVARNKKTYYRVRIGMYNTFTDAKSKADEIKSMIRRARIGAPVVVVQD